MKKSNTVYCWMISLLLFVSCHSDKDDQTDEAIRFMTLDPGHFHAALVHKVMYPQVDSTAYLFAPKGSEEKAFLDKINSYNNRSDHPTHWDMQTYLGGDYLQKMIDDHPGNVMITAGKNSKKIDYVLSAIDAGINVYADKPLVINPDGFKKLKKAFETAEKNDILLYDIMTERFEVTTALQKFLSQDEDLFGTLIDGTPEEPAITKESVHHFYKYVSGAPLVRPAWFFDVNEEGDGLVDVTTHLVDLVQWEAFPEQIIDTNAIEMLSARRWATPLTAEEFTAVTGVPEIPDYLQNVVEDDKIQVQCNGEMIYKINGKTAKVSVIWNYKAPEGAGDTHYSVMRGSNCDLIIKQGEDEDFKPTLYISSAEDISSAIDESLSAAANFGFSGCTSEKLPNGLWRITIPDLLKVGHEAHFAQVTENYLDYLSEGTMPDWEVPNMIAKYFTIMEAYKMAGL